MNQSTKDKLLVFANSNNWGLPHPLDNERFYDFILEAFRLKEYEISSDDFRAVFEDVGRKSDLEDQVQKWKIKYDYGIDLLRYYKKETM